MFGKNSLAKGIVGLVIGFAGLVAVSGGASAAVLTVENGGIQQLGTAPGTAGTALQRVDLGALGLTSINTIVLTDISGQVGGNPGIFSGYDLDAVFLDRDGDITTTDDQIAFSGLTFTPGTRRPTTETYEMEDLGNNYGLYYGTNAAGNVAPFGPGNIKDAKLDKFDALNVAHRLNANGYLTLGDGGILTLTFADILVGEGLYLVFGEVGGQGEKLQVEIPGQVPLPGAVWLFLSAIAVLFGMSRRRNVATA